MIIQTDAELAAYCASIRKFPILLLDTEFVGEGRYYPDLGTIQIAAITPESADPGDTVALVDPLAVEDLSPLLSILVDPAIEKVFHAAIQDLAIFYRYIGKPVAPVFDTQIAAALLGYDEQISFGALAERATGVHLRKGHSFTDWLQRPLSPKQVEYALDDVRYLAPIYAHLVSALNEQGRLEWAGEEFRRLEEPARFAPVDPRELYMRIRGVERMRGQELALLRDLVAWREETAREQTLNPGRICTDPVLCDLARHPRERKDELYDIRGLRAQQVDRFGDGMIAVIQNSNGTPPLPVKRTRSLPASLEPTVDFLTLCLRSLAAEGSVSSTLIATRSDLDAVALHGENADVALMRGWRREAFGDALLDTLRGNATARILPDTRQVHLEWHRAE
jgi:ribonuclease D